jgi:hypothetical protein
MRDGITQAAFELIRLNRIQSEKENNWNKRKCGGRNKDINAEFVSGIKDQKEIDVNENNILKKN